LTIGTFLLDSKGTRWARLPKRILRGSSLNGAGGALVAGDAVEVDGGGTAPPNWASNSAKSLKLENLKGEGRFGDPKILVGWVKGLPWEPRGVPAGLGRGLTGNRISLNRGGLVVVVVVVVVEMVVLGVVVVVVAGDNFDVASVDFCLAFTLTLLLSPDTFFPTTFLLFTMAGL